MLGHRELNIDDYLAILRRRWWVVLVPAILGPAIAYGLSLKLPSRYTSQTLILVEGQKVPDSFVMPVVTGDLSSRLATMEEQILSRTHLEPIIERFSLFKREAGQEPMEELVNRMRRNISLTPLKSMVTGFTVSFTADNPQLAQQVSAEITSMLIEENLRQRTRSAQGTTNFLQSQLEDAKRSLDEQDARLAEFKTKYMGMLPDESQTNLNILGTLNTQLEAVTQSVNRAQADKGYAESLLNQQITTWESVKGGDNPHPETVEQQLAGLESALAGLETRYTSNHPDVIKLKTTIEQLKKKVRESAPVPKDKRAPKTQENSLPEPLQIQQLRNQIRSYQSAIQERTREQERLQGQIKLYQSRVQLSPAIEQQYRQVTRDYQTALDFYNDLLKKKNQSEMATNLERRQEGEQFKVMDPANLPEKPSFPNRPMFAAAGFGGGLALGLGLTLLLELRDKSLRTERDIQFFLLADSRNGPLRR